jgi:hypothetical protein
MAVAVKQCQPFTSERLALGGCQLIKVQRALVTLRQADCSGSVKKTQATLRRRVALIGRLDHQLRVA